MHFDYWANNECKGRAVFDWTNNFLGSLRQALQGPWL
jgi:hypothetical protein